MKSSLIRSYVSLISVFLLVDLVASQVMPVPGDCHKYQVCDYSGCFVFNCGIGTEFNPRILVCDYPLRDRGACGSRDNLGPLIDYPGRAVDSYPGNQGAVNTYPGSAPGAYPGNTIY